MDKKEIKEKFASSFKFKEHEFSEPIIFEGDKIGFSTQKKLNPSIINKLQIEEGHEYISLIHVSLPDENLTEKIKNPNIVVRIGLTLMKDGKFLIDDSHIKNKKYEPIELISTDDYSYEYEKDCFYINGQASSISKIIEDIYKKHTKPSNTISGLPLRITLNFWRSFLPETMKLISAICAFLYHFITGGKLTYQMFEQNIKIEPEESEGAKFTFYDYHASKKTIFLYCFFHLMAYSIYFIFDIYPKYLSKIFRNNFLTIIYIIVTLTILDKGIPNILEYIFEKSSKQRLKLLFKKIKV